MAAPKGNNYWQFRDKHGRNHKYEPEELWKEFISYSKWLEEHPLKEQLVFHSQGEITKTDSPKMRAMTLKGFHLFADISNSTWINYKNNKDFLTITTRIHDAIYTQKFEGAAATLLHPNIIARDLGLTDKKEVETSDVIKYKNVSKQFPDKE